MGIYFIYPRVSRIVEGTWVGDIGCLMDEWIDNR